MNDALKENLFRQEALDALNAKHYGRPIARMPRMWAFFAVLLVLITVSAAVFLTTSTYSRKETVVGWLIPDKGLVRLSAGQYGLVESLMVEEGSVIKEGEPILVLSSDNGLVGGGRATEALLVEIAREEVELIAQIDLVQEILVEDTDSLEASLAQMELEKQSLEEQIAEQDNRVDIAADILRRFEILRHEAVSQVQVEQQRETLAAQRQIKEGLVQRRHTLNRESQLQQDRLERLPLETDRLLSELRARKATLSARKIELSSRGRQVITSPVSGTIASLGAKAGSSISPERSLAEILPEGSTLFAEIYIPSRAIGFVEEGMPVRLMYEAFPHQRFGSGEGEVSQVTNTILRPEEIPTPLRMEESAYKARAMLKVQSIDAFERSFPLRPGMALQAEIILEQRSFLQWLLEPVMARRGWSPSETTQ
ncbi:MAG: HlyD family efflux transporter periplasmic adaptor subunit [Pseudohongiellaceae bacterium]